MRRPSGIDHRPTIRRTYLGPMPGISFAEALRSKRKMAAYRAEWAICQRRRGWLLLLPAVGAAWLTWMLLTNPDLVANTDSFVQWMLALPAIVLGLACALSILWPMALFDMMHPTDRNRERSKP